MHLAVSNGLTTLLNKVLDVVEAAARSVALPWPYLIGLLSIDFSNHLILLIWPQLSLLIYVVGLHELLGHENEWIGVYLDFLL